jgi:hypothetical protein
MQFEDFDKRVKEAADHHHPAYDEQAWAKMEKLLNKHLPQKDDDRRRFLFIILLFLGLGGAGLFILKPWKKDKQETIATVQPVKQDPQGGSTTTKEQVPVTGSDKYTMPGDPNSPVPANPTTEKPVITINGVPVETTAPGESKTTNITLKSRNSSPDNNLIAAGTKIIRPRKATASNKTNGRPVADGNNNPIIQSPQNVFAKEPTTNVAAEPVTADKKKTEDVGSTAPVVKTQATAVSEDQIKPEDKTTEAKADPKKENPVVAKSNEKKAKDKKKKVSSFFVSLSAGPDMSFVNNNKAGQVKLLAGAGLGYNYKDRFTIRTGFYSARKIYTAGPDAYDPPAEFYTLYPYLEKVDANCKVYEIPVSLSYNFGKNRNFFVSAGLSTFLMNEETYNYHYKYTPMGNTYTNEWTVKNKNSHFFSVATLSAGYKKDINKRLTVMAEPYFKLPLGGVGYGKVKLNSGGVLFTVGIKPF